MISQALSNQFKIFLLNVMNVRIKFVIGLLNSYVYFFATKIYDKNANGNEKIRARAATATEELVVSRIRAKELKIRDD